MSLLGFAYFVTVAKEGNISRAAEKLYVSQQCPYQTVGVPVRGDLI